MALLSVYLLLLIMSSINHTTMSTTLCDTFPLRCWCLWSLVKPTRSSVSGLAPRASQWPINIFTCRFVLGALSPNMLIPPPPPLLLFQLRFIIRLLQRFPITEFSHISTSQKTDQQNKSRTRFAWVRFRPNTIANKLGILVKQKDRSQWDSTVYISINIILYCWSDSPDVLGR